MNRDKPPRRIIFARDGYTCQYCGDYGNQIEHVIPWVFTQDDSLGNLVVACSRCNGKAGGKPFVSFEAKREWILRARDMPERIPEQLPEHLCEGCGSRQWCVAQSICYAESYVSRGHLSRLLADSSPVEQSNRAPAVPLGATGAELFSEFAKIESEWVRACRRAGIGVS